jgi:SAM-dependent methyltransferase
MTGVEPAKAMLDIARQSPEANKVKWIEGDILKLSELNFDLAMMTAHVAQFLLDEQYWLNNLESIHNALRTGGYLVFDSKNPTTRPWINSWPTKDSPRIVVDPTLGKTQWSATLIEINKNRVIYEIVCLIAQTGEELVSVNELIFRSKEEIIQSLIKSGFEIENIYGDWDSSSVTKESAEFIFVAKKI